MPTGTAGGQDCRLCKDLAFERPVRPIAARGSLAAERSAPACFFGRKLH